MNAAPVAAIMAEEVQLHNTVDWSGKVEIGDSIWIGDYQMTITTVNTDANDVVSFFVSGADVQVGFEGVVAFEFGNGFERSIILKSMTGHINTARVTLESDWRGTNVQVLTHRTDGIAPNTFKLGGYSQKQTVTFRAPSAEVSADVANSGLFYSLMLGPDVVGNLTYGASAEEWKAALDSLLNVERVAVTRNGDGSTATWSYGYSYTVAFWGAYGTQTLPQLTSDTSLIPEIEVHLSLIHI